MKTIYFNENTILAFHIGRGGHFNNPGHVELIGEKKIGEFVGNLFSPVIDDADDPDGYREDERPEAEWTMENGSSCGLTNAMVESGIGRIEEDGEYDTTYTMYLKDIEEGTKEWDAIFSSSDFEAEQAQMFLRPELAINTLQDLADYINKNEDWDEVVVELIERNKWDPHPDEWDDICNDGEQKVRLREQGGGAEVVEL